MKQNENPNARGYAEVGDEGAAKKEYRSPQLVSYGNVAELTQNGASNTVDDNPTMKT